MIVKKRLRPRTGFDNVVRRRTLRAVRMLWSDRVLLVFSLGPKNHPNAVCVIPHAPTVTSIAANLDSRSV
jgi:hypothetical protein